MNRPLLIALALAVAATGTATLAQANGEVNIYSYRKEGLIRPFLDRFTASTGIKVNLVTGKADALLKRLESEGRNSPADLLLTVDAGRLHRARQAGVLQTVQSDVLVAAVPAHLRDPEGYWYGLSKRARIVVYRTGSIAASDLPDYEDLATPAWKGRVCIRSSSNIYNQSLLAAIIAAEGEAAAQQWANGMVANFARAPKGNDRAQIKAVAAGECDIAVVNNYYLGKMQTSTKDDGQREAVAKVSLHYPSLDGKGTHINVSGAGVTRYAPNRENAVKLLEFLVSDAEQFNYATENFEYPVKAGIDVSDRIKSWGGYPFKESPVAMEALGENNARAVMVFDRAGWK